VRRFALATGPDRLRRVFAADRGVAARKLLLSAAAGLVLPLAFAPFGWFWLAPLSYALLFYAWGGATPAQAFRRGLLYGLASFGAGIYWVYISIHDFGQLNIPLTLLLTGGLVAIMSLFVALTGWIAAKWLSTRGAVAWLGVLPALWVLTEWCRGWLFSGFGWLSAGYSQTDSWLMSLAPVLGLHGMSWAVMISAGVLVALVLGRRRERVAAALLLAAVWGAAFGLGSLAWTAPEGEPLTVSLVQGAVPPELKWEQSEFERTLALYRDLTEQSKGSRLIVWPEAAIPTLIDYVPGYIAEMDRWAATHGTSILLGILMGTPEDYRNTVVSLPDPKRVYVKRHLVPFGEYFPVPGFVRSWLRLMSLPYIDAEPGPADQPALDVAGQRIGITICYEDVFGAEQLPYLPEATLLVNVSNDAWFGDSIAPHQHLQIAQVRAAEAGRYLLRATNTGVTAIIDPRGRVVETLPQFAPGTLQGEVRGRRGATPYARVGNYPVVSAAFLLVLVPLAVPFARRRERARR
jgi:apolipoprotein N-acyltransferase